MVKQIWDQPGEVELTRPLYHRLSQCLRFCERGGQGPSVTPMQHTSGHGVPRNLFQMVTTVPCGD